MRGNSAISLYMFRVRGKVERPKTGASNGFYTRNGNFQHPTLAKVVYAEFLFRFAKSLEDFLLEQMDFVQHTGSRWH